MLSSLADTIKTPAWSLSSQCPLRAAPKPAPAAPAGRWCVPSGLVTPPSQASASSAATPPPPLTVAVSLAGLEAVALVLYGATLVPGLSGERLVMGLTSVAFFWAYGAGLAFCAWQLYRLNSWARAPIVLAQLIQVMVGVDFWGGSTTAVAVLLIAVGVLVLAGIFHPASLAALEESDRDQLGGSGRQA